MNMNKSLNDKDREAIFELFIRHHALKFSEIEKALKIRSNHLSYHISKLIENNILSKNGETYKLTKEAERMIPFFANITGKEDFPLAIVVSAVYNKGKICLIKREKRPYKGYWGLVGGKMYLSESIKDCAVREVKEETGLNCTFDKVSAVLHERVRDEKIMKHAFTIFLCKLLTNEIKIRNSEEGDVQWFSINKLPKNIIPTDRVMINELLNKRSFSCKEVILDDKDGKLIKMEVEDGGTL